MKKLTITRQERKRRLFIQSLCRSAKDAAFIGQEHSTAPLIHLARHAMTQEERDQHAKDGKDPWASQR